jgi:hypothetical protein
VLAADASGQVSHGTAVVIIIRSNYVVVAADSLEITGNQRSLTCKISATHDSTYAASGIGGIADKWFGDVYTEIPAFRRRLTATELSGAARLWAERVRKIETSYALSHTKDWNSLDPRQRSTGAIIASLSPSGAINAVSAWVATDRIKNSIFPYLYIVVNPQSLPNTFEVGHSAGETYRELKSATTLRSRAFPNLVSEMNNPPDLSHAVDSAKTFIHVAESWHQDDVGGPIASFKLSFLGAGSDSEPGACDASKWTNHK